MKRKERYKILNYAKKQYSEAFDLDLQFKHLSKKKLYKMLDKYKHSSMCEWSYCCYGLYRNCWQESIEEGNWNLTQKDVNESIKYVIDIFAKACRKDSRILYCELDNNNNNRIDVIIVIRDVHQTDYLITFTNEEY